MESKHAGDGSGRISHLLRIDRQCETCKILVGVLESLLESGASEGIVEAVLIQFCTNFKLQDPAVVSLYMFTTYKSVKV